MKLLASAPPPRRLLRRSSPSGCFPQGSGRGGASRCHLRGGNRGAALRRLSGQPRGRSEAPAAADGGRAAGTGGGRPPWRAAGPRPPSTWSGCTTSSAGCTPTSAAPRSDCDTEPPVGAAAGGGRARGGAATLSGPASPHGATAGKGQERGAGESPGDGLGARDASRSRQFQEAGLQRDFFPLRKGLPVGNPGFLVQRSPAGRCAGAVQLGHGSLELS